MIDTSEASSPATGTAADGHSASGDAQARAHTLPRRAAPTGSSPAQPPRITRPHGLAHATRPVEPPAPDHHHLPGWVRRAHAQARPILADLLGNLEGGARDQYMERVGALVGGISRGRFSLAWQYPRLIGDGMQVLTEQRRESAEVERARRALDQRRKKVGDALRDAGGRLAPEVVARLHRAVRDAATPDAVDSVAGEVEQSVAAARSTEERRRDREIDRTRTRMRRTLPGAAPAPVAETWQDVLRRFAESQTEG